MDRLTQLKSEASSSKDSSLDSSSASAYLTANDSSKYFSLSEEDSSFVRPVKDVSLNSAAADVDKPITETDQLLSNLSPSAKQNELLDSYKFGKQIEAANILSGGVNIFDDNESSYDGDGLVIDDNVVDSEDKSNPEPKDAALGLFQKDDMTLVDNVAELSDVASKDTEIVLQIDGKNVNAINIGNDLYLYRKEGQEELAAVQIIDNDQQQSSFKFLKVRENAEGNLEVYEEIEIEVPKETPLKHNQTEMKITSHPTNAKSIVNPEAKAVESLKTQIPTELAPEIKHLDKETTIEPRTENINNKMSKFNETLKWGLHSTPNKEGIPLTKIMVDQQLHPNRHLDKVKTIEVHTEPKKPLDLQVSIPPVESSLKKMDTTENKVIEMKDSTDPLISKKHDSSESIASNSINTLDIASNSDMLQASSNEANKLIAKIRNPVEVQNIRTENAEFQKQNDINDTITIEKPSEGIVEVTMGNIILQNVGSNATLKSEASQCEKLEMPKVAPSKNLMPVTVRSLPDTKIILQNVGSNATLKSEASQCEKLEMPKVAPSKNLMPVTVRSLPDTKIILQNVGSNATLKSEASQCEKLEMPKVAPSKNLMPVTVRSLPDTKIILQNVGSNATLKSEASQCEKLEMPKVAPSKNLMPVTVRSLPDTKMSIKGDVVNVRASSNFEIKPINNNQTGDVPFGKWTSVNRQAYVSKLKESKITPNINAKQIKQPNDLNKREFLQKIDSQRQNTYTTVKLNERRVAPKLHIKSETETLANKLTVTSGVKLPLKGGATGKSSALPAYRAPDETITKVEVAKHTTVAETNMPVALDNTQQKRNQELIDKTIEGIINRVITAPPEDLTLNSSNVVPTERKNDNKLIARKTVEAQAKNTHPASLDAIEIKMNELHGIPFIERPPHQLPKFFNQDVKTYSKADTSKDKVTSASSGSTSCLQKNVKQNVIDVDSEEEIIEYEPVTGDMDIKTRPLIRHQITTQLSASQTVPATNSTCKTDAIITEKDFDKFARRNSVTYENQLIFENSNAVSKIVDKDLPPIKKYSRNELLLAEAKVKSDQKQQNRINHPNKITHRPVNDDAQNKNYQSKLQMAYQSALTAKRKNEPLPPVLVLEDKPVKVVFVNESSEFPPSKLNIQGNALSPKKKISDVVITTKNDSQDSLSMENATSSVNKCTHKVTHDDIKKGRQRKQLLTPVDTPELELIEPHDLGIASSPKKKRGTVEPPLDESPENVPLKTYLQGRNKVAEDTESSPQDLSKAQMVCNNPTKVTDTATAIDNLVKAAELLETQSENLDLNSSTASVDSQLSQPLKRGRGRPRKYPLAESPSDKSKAESPSDKSKSESPQKRPRLTKPTLRNENTPTDEDTSDEEVIRENWTMGKIDEQIVCPICKKLFRSENVVFKHVKHCTGPSPNRSDSDNVSRKSIQSQESETKSVDSKFDDVDYEPLVENKQKNITPKKFKSKNAVSESSRDIDDIIVIEDTPKSKPHESGISSRAKTASKDSLACDICGKTFRQLSYLVNHKWQHKKEPKNVDENPEVSAKSVIRCDFCKKEFRKLHHLVQHRLIHNPITAPVRSSRKSSFENIEQRPKITQYSKPLDDPSAGFRCEPCDKSFRKLHHLVEHRETHDGQNKQKTVPAVPATEDKASDPPPQCDICKKTFRKLHHLAEHKEQHLETTSEKSDDKSVKSSLSTKDIIHECRLCYMVFPNEHSLNKHSVFCQRKKKPAVKPPQPNEEEAIVIDSPEPAIEQVAACDPIPVADENITEQKEISTSTSKADTSSSINEIADVVSEKVPPKENTITLAEIIEEKNNITDKTSIVRTTTKRKSMVKEKVTAPVTKRPKPTHIPLPVIKEVQPVSEASDDDEVRYMINPEYKPEPSVLFMKVRANKRNSLQIEKPNKELMKRRASLQHLPKSRVEDTNVPIKSTAFMKNSLKINKAESVPSTDSDDSDVNVKYSFPETVTNKPATSDPAETKKDNIVKRKSITNKRKSLSGMAKRKSVGKIPVYKQKEPPSATAVRLIKRRTLGVEHRCDCGQLFSSAALLSRHTSLSHTPPRIRRRRSPPPALPARALPPARVSTAFRTSADHAHTNKTHAGNSQDKTIGRRTSVKRDEAAKTTKKDEAAKATKKDVADKATKKVVADKATKKDDAAKATKKDEAAKATKKDDTAKATKKDDAAKSTKRDDAAKSTKKDDTAKSTKKDDVVKSTKKDDASKSAKSGVKSRNAHRGVPVPEKMKKLAEKLKG